MFIQEANAIASYHFNAAFCQLWDSIVMPSVRFQRDSSRAPFLNWSAILASSETAAKKVKIWWWRRLRENTNSTSSSFAHLAWCILEMYTAISIVAAFNWSLPKKNIQNFKFSIQPLNTGNVFMGRYQAQAFTSLPSKSRQVSNITLCSNQRLCYKRKWGRSRWFVAGLWRNPLFVLSHDLASETVISWILQRLAA